MQGCFTAGGFTKRTGDGSECVPECRLIDHGVALRDELGRAGDARMEIVVALRGAVHATGEALLRQLAHVCARAENGLLLLVRGIAQLAVIPVEVEPLEALRPVHEGGLGEEVGFVGHGRGLGSIAEIMPTSFLPCSPSTQQTESQLII